MKIEIDVEKRHAYAIIAVTMLLLGGLFVTAFGGGTPSVLGHSALELLVNGSSISSNNITSTHIDAATLAGAPCAAITGSSSLCDGGDVGLNGCASQTPAISGSGIDRTCTCSGGLTLISGGPSVSGSGDCAIPTMRHYFPSGVSAVVVRYNQSVDSCSTQVCSIICCNTGT